MGGGKGVVILSHLLANNLAQLVDILEQHVVVRHGHPGERGCSPRGLPPTPLNESSMIRPFLSPPKIKNNKSMTEARRVWRGS